jgi:hypothetical protein
VFAGGGAALILQAYEVDRTDAQLEDIADWLRGHLVSNRAGGLEFGFSTKRLPVGVMQGEPPAAPRLTLRQLSYSRLISTIDGSAWSGSVAQGRATGPGPGRSGRGR